ncbi:MAG: S9 family peptidase [Micropruina sp.]
MSVVPPIAPRRPHIRSHHGDEVVDDYAWMSDKNDPELLEVLTAENEYCRELTAPLEQLRAEIFADIKARTQETDLSVPDYQTHNDGAAYWYYARTEEGLDYAIHCRAPAASRDEIPEPLSLRGVEEVLLDENALAAGREFFALGTADISPNGQVLAYSLDVSGDERYSLRFRDLRTGTDLPDQIDDVGEGGCWVGDAHYWYVAVDHAWRPYQVWRHELGGGASAALVHHEKDDRFWLGVEESRDRAWAMIALGSRTTSEYRILPVSDPTGSPRTVSAREEGLEYSIELAQDRLFVVHNREATDFALAQAPLTSTSSADWVTLWPGEPGVRLHGVSAYARALVWSLRREGLSAVHVQPRTSSGDLLPGVDLAFDEALREVVVSSSEDYDTDRIRYAFESLVTPRRIEEYRLDTGERRLLKQTPVLDHPEHGPYRAADYVQRREWVVAPDGTRIPLSIVHRAGLALDGTAPCLLYGYGAYELPVGLRMSIVRLSLLDRGFVYAIAHVRGGGELGRSWYEGGRLANKRNTFTDFIACARFLADAGYTSPDRLVAEGGSAGGLLIGAAINLAPDAFRAVHAAVPFVDALTTILKPELPLTVSEWDEWGNPLEDPEVYAYLKSYSPYENVAPQKYPSILVTTSLNDTRVEVTEPAKWVAKLRRIVPADPERPILLKTELVAGHGGASGRYDAWRDAAFEVAWMISQVARPDEST